MQWARVSGVVLFGLLVVADGFTYAEEEQQEPRKSVIQRGQQEFNDTCALCHGEDAKGKGPWASGLAIQAPDLTKLMERNEGEFPFLNLYFIIDGQMLIDAHGTRKMPIWGKRFSREHDLAAQSEFGSETYATGKIMELILYLYSIQE